MKQEGQTIIIMNAEYEAQMLIHPSDFEGPVDTQSYLEDVAAIGGKFAYVPTEQAELISGLDQMRIKALIDRLRQLDKF